MEQTKEQRKMRTCQETKNSVSGILELFLQYVALLFQQVRH